MDMDLDDHGSSGNYQVDMDDLIRHDSFSFTRRGMMMHPHEKHIDKVVHTDFFNKFDDLLDDDDLQ